MKTRTLLLALLAVFAVGCSSSEPETSAQTNSPTPTDTVAAAGGTESTPVEAGQAAAEPAGETPATEAAKPAPDKSAATPKAAAPATARTAPAAGNGGVSAEQRGDAPRGGGAQGGRQRGRGMNMGMMLRSDQFKAELKITPDQVKKLEAALPKQGQGGGGQDTTPEERAKQRAEVEKKVQAILTPAQQLRIKEIELQMQGARALTREPVAKELGLSADQVKKIETALEAGRPQGGPGAGAGGGAPGGGGPGAGGGGFDREAFMKAREEANKKALAVLTAAQKVKWAKMIGKPFVFQRPEGGPGGGGNRSIT